MNHAPTADAGGPYTVAEGGSVTVAATGGDADGDALTYAWDLDNDGEFDDATGSDGELLRRDDRRAGEPHGPCPRQRRRPRATIDTATVNVTNVDPTATFNAPASAFAGFPFELSLTNATDVSPGRPARA